MRNTLIAIALIACTMLAGCGQQNIKDVLSNLDKDCVRHYAGSAATGTPVGSATITFQIDCQPSSGVTPPPVTNPAAKPPSQ